MKHKLRYLTMLMCFTIIVAKAQDRTVSGTVISSEDELGVPGVNVVLQGTAIGTITDMNGRFSIMDARLVLITWWITISRL